jgi:hypothetical protein
VRACEREERCLDILQRLPSLDEIGDRLEDQDGDDGSDLSPNRPGASSSGHLSSSSAASVSSSDASEDSTGDRTVSQEPHPSHMLLGSTMRFQHGGYREMPPTGFEPVLRP